MTLANVNQTQHAAFFSLIAQVQPSAPNLTALVFCWRETLCKYRILVVRILQYNTM